MLHRQRPASAKPALYGSGKSVSEELNFVRKRPVSAPRKAIEAAASRVVETNEPSDTAGRKPKHNEAWEELVESTGFNAPAPSGKLEVSSFDWAAIVHAEQQIFKSDALKLETALAELDHVGHPASGAASSLVGLDKSPKPFRTAVCCRILLSLADSMGKYRHLYKRIASEMMHSIYSGYDPSRKQSAVDLAKEQTKPIPHQNSRLQNQTGEEAPTQSAAGAPGFVFDLEPYYIKVPSLEGEVNLLRREKDELLRKQAILQQDIDKKAKELESLSREKDGFELEKQIAVVQLRRAHEEQEIHDQQVAKVRKDAKDDISIAHERTERLRLELAKLKQDTAKMVPAVFEETARKNVDEVWEMLEDTRKETLVALKRRRERIDMSQFVGAHEQNLGLLFDEEQRAEELSDFSLKMFLQRWVGYRMDRWFQEEKNSWAANAAPRKRREVLPFGWAWRECDAMIDLFQACFPGAFEELDAPPEELSIPERANVICAHLESVSGMKLIAPIELQSGNEGSITLVAAFLFTTHPTLDSVSTEFDKDLCAQREKVAEIDALIERLQELEKEIQDSKKNAHRHHQQMVGRLEGSEKDSAHAFISLLVRLQPILEEAEAKQKDLRSRLDSDRQLWTAIFTGCGNFCFRNIVKRAAMAESALERERELTKEMQATLAKKSKRFTQPHKKATQSHVSHAPRRIGMRLPLSGQPSQDGGLRTGRSMQSIQSSRSRGSRSGQSDVSDEQGYDGLLTNRSGASMMSDASGRSHRSTNKGSPMSSRPANPSSAYSSYNKPSSAFGSFRSNASSAESFSRSSSNASPDRSLAPSRKASSRSIMASPLAAMSRRASVRNLASPAMSRRESAMTLAPTAAPAKPASKGRRSSVSKSPAQLGRRGSVAGSLASRKGRASLSEI